MIELPVYNKQGEQVSTFALDESLLGGEVRYVLLKQAYVRQHAGQRQGSARTKSRGMIAGSTRKLYRQKGTGNARMGTVRTSIRKGGGVAFAKTKEREAYRLDMPKRMRRLANRNALLAKAVDQEIRVIDDLSFDRPRTAEFARLLKSVGIDRTCLVAFDPANVNGRLSAQNIDDVTTLRWDQLNVFQLLNHRYLVISRADLQAFLDGAHHTGSGRGRGDAQSARDAGGESEAA